MSPSAYNARTLASRFEARLRLLLRKFSRTHWLLRFLHLSISEGPANRPGLVMLQIDGLSLDQFNRALNKGELPFLKRLIKREHYQVHTLYSGLPASTPAVQGELFYGIKTVVPAFSFLNREKGEIVRMLDPTTAHQVKKNYANSWPGTVSIRFARAAVRTRIFTGAVWTWMKRTFAPRHSAGVQRCGQPTPSRCCSCYHQHQ